MLSNPNKGARKGPIANQRVKFRKRLCFDKKTTYEPIRRDSKRFENVQVQGGVIYQVPLFTAGPLMPFLHPYTLHQTYLAARTVAGEEAVTATQLNETSDKMS